MITVPAYPTTRSHAAKARWLSLDCLISLHLFLRCRPAGTVFTCIVLLQTLHTISLPYISFRNFTYQIKITKQHHESAYKFFSLKKKNVKELRR